MHGTFANGEGRHHDETHVCLTTSCKREIKKLIYRLIRGISDRIHHSPNGAAERRRLYLWQDKNSEIDTQLRALGAPTGAIDGVYNEWEGLPFVEVVLVSWFCGRI